MRRAPASPGSRSSLGLTDPRGAGRRSRARSCSRRGRRARTGSASSSPTATGPRWPRSARSRGSRRRGRRSLQARRGATGGALTAGAVADAPDGPPGAGLVALGGFAFAPDGGARAALGGLRRRRPDRPRGGAGAPRRRRPAHPGRAGRRRTTCRTRSPRGCSAAPPRCGSAPLPLLDPAPGRALPRSTRRRRPSTTRAPSRAPSSASGAGAFEKIVLAREVTVHAPTRPRRGGGLRRAAGGFESCYVFCAGRGDAAFVAASPELLIRRDGQRAQTVALAGSTRRSADPAVDDHLGEQLLRSRQGPRGAGDRRPPHRPRAAPARASGSPRRTSRR